MKLLYVKNKNFSEKVNNEFDVLEFRPSIGKIYFKGETKSIKVTIIRIWFQIMTFGKAKLVCAVNKTGNIMHTSYVIPKCFKFPFLNKNEYEIGPCNTIAEFRGQGVYPKVLNYITNTVGTESTKFYMIVDSGNLSSVRGIEKAKFEKIGEIEKRGIFKRYFIKSKENEL